MTIATDAARPDGRVLLDADGREIARIEEAERDGRRVTDLFTLSVPAEQALPTVLTWVDDPRRRLRGGAILVNDSPGEPPSRTATPRSASTRPTASPPYSAH